jgi:hypothetical protein
MPKAQAAMERLMTMGYGLLTVLIVIGALAYFDILTPSKFIPEKCVLGGGLKCADYQLQFQKVTLKVENTLARDMVITKVKLLSKDLQDEGCSVDTNIALKPLTSADVEINNCAFTSTGKKKVTINVVYRYGSNIDHTQEGELVLQIDNPYTPTGTHADSCLDSDLGLVYYTEGTVSGWYNNEYYSIIDTCNLDGIHLNEYTCTGNYQESTSYECPNDCYFGHGVCKELDSCSDPDGSNFDYSGAATGFKDGYEFNNPDYCKPDGITLNESTCSGVSPAFTLNPCTYGCELGKCKAAPGDSCLDPDGSDFDTAGAATGFKDGYEFNNPDYCKPDGITLNESTCSGVSPDFTLQPCSPDICLDGKCTAPTYSCTGTLTCTGLSQVNCQNCPVCSYTVESCSGTASSCSSYGTQGNCQLCGCSWAASTIQKVGGDVAGRVVNGTGSQAVSLPSGLQAGDIVIAAVACDNSLNPYGVIGYTDIQRSTTAVPGRNIAYKVMGSTPDSTVNIAREPTRNSSYVIQAWRGVDTTNVFDVATPTELSGTTLTPNAPPITPVTVGALVIAIGALDDDDATVTSHPGGFTNGVSANAAQTSTANGATIMMASMTWSSGSPDPGAWTLSGGNDAWLADTIALRPTPGGCSGMTTYSCTSATCDSTCGCTSIPSSCSNSGTCATCPLGSCTSCPGCVLS